MSIDRAKAQQNAQKYLAKGQLDKAISEYERLVKDDPKDGRLLLKLGDLYTRQGASKEACGAYRRVAEQYAEQGFFLKAVAVCKQILKLDPTLLDVWERLAEMYEMLSLGNDAVATWEQVADAHARAGNNRKSAKALEKVAELDPENVAARIRYAEVLSKLNKPEEAAAAFAQGAEVLKRQGRIEDYLKVGERLLYHQPDNLEFAREIAAAYLDRGEAKHSLAKLQACFNADPKNLETLQLLARAFEQLGQTQKTVSVLKELARLHSSEARKPEQASVLRRILALDPSDADARRELSQIGRMPVSEDSSAAIMVEEDDYDELVVEEDDELAPKTGSGLRDLALVEEEQKQERVARLLAECGVFLRYGLNDKMIKQLHELLTLDPQHVEARLKLKDAYLRVKQPAEAAKQLLALAEIVERSDTNLALSALREAVKLEPKNARAADRLRALEAAAPPAGRHAEEEDVVFVDEVEGDQATDVIATKPEESFASVIPDNYDDLGKVAVPPAAAAPKLAPQPLAAPPQAARPASAPLREDSQVIMLDDEVADADLDDGSQPEPAAAPASIAPEDDPELADVLEEVEFYLKQGLRDEARDTLTDALETYPDHPVLLRRMKDVEQALSMPPAPRFSGRPSAPSMPPAVPSKPPESEPASEDHSFELAQKLAEEVAAPAAGSGAGPIEVSDVLAAFKKGVAKQIDQADSATHYDLGIAYMEMGLHGEAIDEFKLCLSDPTRLCTAHTMIALSYVAKGDMDPGIEHFRSALASNPNEEEEIGLWFEMGNAHELLGKNMEALVWYEKVEERNPNFRDVAMRIERLGTARTPQQEADEFDEMFDNMILKE
ncbi:MAG TPA: tetratricopeptide repeat protein [Polyangiales bacterium]|nr:tetratricopeptide repeat protein [Polyangiales bacterium]